MAAISRVGSIKKYFRCLKDPRVRGRTEHRLIDIIAIALCGVIANCDGWTDIIDFANNRLAWFKRFLALPNGIPAHDTFERVFAKIDPAVFNRCCMAWLRDVSDLVGLGHLAIDGKTLRGSASCGLRPLHLVSAWATQANLSLGEVAVEGKSNEIKAIPELLKLLDLKGSWRSRPTKSICWRIFKRRLARPWTAPCPKRRSRCSRPLPRATAEPNNARAR